MLFLLISVYRHSIRTNYQTIYLNPSGATALRTDDKSSGNRYPYASSELDLDIQRTQPGTNRIQDQGFKFTPKTQSEHW
jgi:hypothetical protein